MEDVNVFEGDVLYTATPDGGDIKIENGLVKDCRNFDTAAYLSLFSGNENDADGREKDTWWGNLIPGTDRSEWMQSEFGATVAGYPLTSANIQKAEAAAGRDLAWLRTEADADEVNVSLSATSAKSVNLSVEVMQDGKKTGGCAYEFQWTEAVR